MLTVNMHEAKGRLSELVNKAEAGEGIVVARNGKPAVRLVPVAAASPRELGVWSHAATLQPDGWDERVPAEELFPDLLR